MPVAVMLIGGAPQKAYLAERAKTPRMAFIALIDMWPNRLGEKGFPGGPAHNEVGHLTTTT